MSFVTLYRNDVRPRLRQAFQISFCFASSLFIFFMICIHIVLKLPFQIQEIFFYFNIIMFVMSIWAGVLISPFVAWALRTGNKNMFKFGSLLWIFMALLTVLSLFNNLSDYLIFYEFALSVIGFIGIGFIKPRLN